MDKADRKRPAAAVKTPQKKPGKTGAPRKPRPAAPATQEAVIAKAPADCSKAELKAFEKLARQSKEVETQGLPQRIRNASVLLMLNKAEKLVGIAALKRPEPAYREGVAQKSGVALPSHDYPYEFGWLYVIPAEEGNGYGYRLLDAALEASKDAGLFATIRMANGAMHHILPQRKFEPRGKPYASSRGDYQLKVYTRRAQTSNALLAEMIQQWESGELPAKKPAPALPGPEFFNQLPDQLVIYLDVLGFAREVTAADQAGCLHEVYRKLHEVQSLLDIPTAAEDCAETTTVNRAHGKTVLALSDSIIIAVDPASEMATHRNPFDILCLEILSVLYAQMDLLAQGIFLRGGVSHGKFHFRDDLLISPGLVRAHQLEDKAALHPRILIGQTTIDWIRSLRGAKYQQPDPLPNYLRPVPERLPDSAEPLHMLDYLPESARANEIRWERADHERYLAAEDGQEKAAILAVKHRKAHEMIMRLHRTQVEAAYAKTAGGVRDKYAWLLTYHNQVVKEFGAEMAPFASTLDVPAAP